MRNKKEIQMLKKKSGNDIQTLSLEIDIIKLENNMIKRNEIGDLLGYSENPNISLIVSSE